MQQKLRQKYLSFLMNRKGTTKLLSGTILLIFFIITFYSFLGDLYGNNTVKANSNSQKIETVDISKKTNLEGSYLRFSSSTSFTIR
ncbi:MAG: hypothetical protein SVR08_16510, partial [Spirochaetota bacterium]|nr:hypothetical protein [Spirochaetota bacterium]